nr:MAG TPA: hypothetical protein [Caudoviricetes sp.]
MLLLLATGNSEMGSLLFFYKPNKLTQHYGTRN